MHSATSQPNLWLSQAPAVGGYRISVGFFPAQWSCMEVSEDDPRNTDYYAEISNVLWTWNGKFMTSWLRNYDGEDTSLTAHPRPYVWAFVIFSSVTRLSFKPKPWSFDHADSMKLHVCFVGGTSLLRAVLRVSPAPEAAVLDQISSRWKARALKKCCSSLLFEE